MGGRSNEASLDVPLDPALYVYSPESEKEFRGLNKELHVDWTRHFSHPDTYTVCTGVGPDTTLAWPGWKQPDIPVEVDQWTRTDLKLAVRRREF